MRWVVLLLVLVTSGFGCGKGSSEGGSGLEGGKLVVDEAFEGAELSEARWNDTAEPGGWRIEGGWLHSKGVRNKALWLKDALPAKVRVEFDVRSGSPDGDIKVEVFGDGETHESGYILIFGGWKNRINTIARLDEHGEDRLEGAPGVKVAQDRVYKMAVVRTDGAVRWYLDREAGTLLLAYEDKAPLVGPRHSHFAFNDWAVPLYFDNLKVYDLGE